MKLVMLITMFLLLSSFSYALITNSGNYTIQFVVKPAFEDHDIGIDTIFNPISGNDTNIYQGFLYSVPPTVVSSSPSRGGSASGSAGQQRRMEEIEEESEITDKAKRNLALWLMVVFIILVMKDDGNETSEKKPRYRYGTKKRGKPTPSKPDHTSRKS